MDDHYDYSILLDNYFPLGNLDIERLRGEKHSKTI